MFIYYILSIAAFMLVLALPLILIVLVVFKNKIKGPMRWVVSLVIILLIAGLVKLGLPTAPEHPRPEVEGAAPSVSAEEASPGS